MTCLRHLRRQVGRQVARQVALAPPSQRNSESGYTLLLVLFMVATLILFAAAATPSIITQGRREREQEALWRGNQYDRAIRLYYRKNGRYPQTLEDLSKADQVGNHYLRKAYRDPLNAADGAWRVIYVTASGQLVGSVHYHSLQEMAATLMPGLQLPTSAGAATAGQQSAFQPTQQTGQPGQQLTQGQGAQPGQTSATPPGQGANQGANPATNQANQGMNQGFGSAQPTALAPLQAVDGPVMGGFAIGVASKIKQPSLIVYQGGKTYFDWEFIYNPLMNAGGAAAPPANAGAASGTAQPPNANGTAQPGVLTAPGANGGTTPFPPGPVGPPPGALNPTQFPPDTSAPSSAP
jgi:type II secretory pathway pseudopilin PulG